MKLIYRNLADYCAQVIDDYQDRVQHVLMMLDHYHCSLQYADYELYNDMANAISDYCEESSYDPSEIDIEELLYY